MSIRPAAWCAAVACIVGACSQTDSPVGPARPPGDATPTPPPATQRIVGTPIGWHSSRGDGSYVIGITRGEAHGGTSAVYMVRTSAVPPSVGVQARAAALAEPFAHVSQSLRADANRGRRMRWSGWLRGTDVAGWGAGLWMRIDGPGVTQGFDNMDSRQLQGTADWQQFSVVLDVPANAIGIAFGVLIQGTGEVLADDFAFEVVGDSVPVTNLMPAFPSGFDSASIAALYAPAPSAPRNLDFEGMTDQIADAAAWLATVAAPLATVEPGTDRSDLQPLRGMIGTARLVGMGEGTHGTREFFRLKHRVFEFLVREMGFTHFAIEATWPEANDVNTYVLTGQGDPTRLLSRLYFWTWRTQEVLDLIQWMRQWNAAAPPDQRVQFLGFDMQYPGAAMDTVANFIGRVDSANAAFVAGRYECLAPYRNVGATFSHPASEYEALPSEVREACRQALLEVFDLLSGRADAYRGASSEAAYQNALHSARVIQQFEEMASEALGSGARDRAMAENVQWLMRQAGPAARMMLWAHNGHVANVAGYMGAALRSAYGDDYVNLGFLFGTGTFNAYEMTGGTIKTLRALPATLVPEGSLESIFLATGQPLLLFDARRIPEAGGAAGLLAEPLTMRHIGSLFDPAREAQYFVSQVFPADFQLLIFVRTGSPSTVLPYTP